MLWKRFDPGSFEVGFIAKVGSFQHYKTTMVAVFLSE